MRKLKGAWLIAVALLTFVAASLAEDRRTDKSEVVVMTPSFCGMACSRRKARPGRAQTEAEDHMAKVAAIVIQSNPDILNLVEVENLDALKRIH